MDTYDPVPVNFIRVRKDVEFEFAFTLSSSEEIGVRWDEVKKYKEGDEVREINVVLEEALSQFFKRFIEFFNWNEGVSGKDAEEIIVNGTKILIKIAGDFMGFGAKTRVGYGRFQGVRSEFYD